MSLPVPTGEESPEGAKQEAVHQTLCPFPGLLQHTRLCRGQDYTAKDPFCSRQALVPHSWAALQREMNHCPCQIAFHLCHQGSLSNRRGFLYESKLSPGHKGKVHLQSWASTHNWTLHLIPVCILSWSPQHSMPALGCLWDFTACTQPSLESLHCTETCLPVLGACPRLLSCIFILEAVLVCPSGLMVRYPSNEQQWLTQALPTSSVEGQQSHCQKPSHSRGRKEGKGPLLRPGSPSVHKVLWNVKEGFRRGYFHTELPHPEHDGPSRQPPFLCHYCCLRHWWHVAALSPRDALCYTKNWEEEACGFLWHGKPFGSTEKSFTRKSEEWKINDAW